MYRLRRSDVIRFAEVMLFASLIVMYCAEAQSDVMLAHYAVRRNITHAVNITAEGNITCPQGQTSLKKARYCVLFSTGVSKRVRTVDLQGHNLAL